VTTEVALALAGAATSAFGLLRFWLRLRFLRDVYKTGGVEHLKAASEAVQGPVRDVASSVANRTRRQKSVTQPDDSGSI
jgi:hypothetical protein